MSAPEENALERRNRRVRERALEGFSARDAALAAEAERAGNPEPEPGDQEE